MGVKFQLEDSNERLFFCWRDDPASVESGQDFLRTEKTNLKPFLMKPGISGLQVLYSKCGCDNNDEMKCVVSEPFDYFHYNMHGEMDYGAYRCLQMVCSFYLANHSEYTRKTLEEVPKIREIQVVLSDLENIEKNFNPRRWIEPHNAAFYTRKFLNICTKEIIYYRFDQRAKNSGSRRENLIEKSEAMRKEEDGFQIFQSTDETAKDLSEIFLNHFRTCKSLIMCDDSIKAYVVAGIRKKPAGKCNDFEVLIFDPHYSKYYEYEDYKNTVESGKMKRMGVFWINVHDFFMEGTNQKRWMLFLCQRRYKTN